MAIVVQCFQCASVLELDDGFRGGVCRCSNCGTLLQVPRNSATPSSTLAAMSASSEAPTTSPPRPAAPPSVEATRPGSPLLDPGLSRGALRTPLTDSPSSGAFARSSPLTAALPPQSAARASIIAAPPPSPPSEVRQADLQRSNSKLYRWIGSLFAVAALVVALVWMFPLLTASPDAGTGTLPSGDAPNFTGANFLTIPLIGKRIVFSIDAGRGSQDTLDYVRSALAQAIPTLADDQQFRVIVWREGATVLLPATAWGTKTDMFHIKGDLDNTPALGTPDPQASLVDSLRLGGDQMIVITPKADLTPDGLHSVLEARHLDERIDIIRLGAGAPSAAVLDQLAGKSNGKSIVLDAARLDTLTHAPH